MLGGLGSRREVLQLGATAASDVHPGLADATEELRVMRETVIEPVFFGTKTDKDAGGPTMASDHDLLRLGHSQVARQVILHPG